MIDDKTRTDFLKIRVIEAVVREDVDSALYWLRILKTWLENIRAVKKIFEEVCNAEDL